MTEVAIGASSIEPPIKVIGKMGRVFDAFLTHGPELHAQQVATLAGLDLSSTSRILTSLVSIGLFRFDQVQRVYTPGLPVLELSRIVLNRFGFREITHREMLALSRRFGWQCNLAVLDEASPDHVVYIDVTSTTADPVERSPIGRRLPAPTTASGRVLLALSTELDQSLAPHGEGLTAHLEEIRRQGYAVLESERNGGYSACAAPLYGADGHVVAALATGTQMRDEFERRRAEVIKAITDTARGISSASRLSGRVAAGL